MPTRSSSTLWLIPTDISINLERVVHARHFPSKHAHQLVQVTPLLYVLPWVDTALLRAKSILLATKMAGLPRSKSKSCNRFSSASAFRKLALSTTEYRTTKASGGFDLSISWSQRFKPINGNAASFIYTYTENVLIFLFFVKNCIFRPVETYLSPQLCVCDFNGDRLSLENDDVFMREKQQDAGQFPVRRCPKSISVATLSIPADFNGIDHTN